MPCEVKNIIAHTLQMLLFEAVGTVIPLLTSSQILFRMNSDKLAPHIIFGLVGNRDG
jgi:hypothetical protein